MFLTIKMKRSITAAITAFLILVLNASAIIAGTKSTDQTSSKAAANEDVYIPKDLDDCFVQLERILQPTDIDKMKVGSEKDMIQYHRSLGMWMRNNWGLWSGSRLKQYFNNLGIHHPDDMSGIILDSFWRHLHGQPIRLEEQIKYYHNYWNKELQGK